MCTRLGMGVSPIDPNRVVITDLGCVHATSDGGKSWRALYTTPSRPHESGKPTPRCDTYRGMGMEPTSAWCLCWMDRENIFAGFTDIRGVRSTDGGKTWGWTYTGHSLNSSYHVLKHPTRDLAFMSTSSVHDMYRSSYLADGTIDRGSGLLLYSADKGASWKCLHDFGHPVIWSAIDPRSPNRMMASVIHSREGGIWMTQDADKLGESTWTRLPQPPRTEGHPMNCHFLDDGSLLVSFSGRRAGNEFTASSGVFISCDSGKSWEDRSAPGLKFWVKELVIDPADKSQNTWYACTFDAWTASHSSSSSAIQPGTDMAHFAADRPLAAEPDTRFNYSSGTTNIIARLVGDHLGGADAMASFLADELFGPLDMRSATPTFDEAGTFIASSYVNATAEDFARFGLLMLRGGVANGRRIVSESWMNYQRTPRSIDPEDGDLYSAQFWVTDDGRGTYSAHGYEGQRIIAAPALDLVIVRLGSTPADRSEHLRAWEDAVLDAVAGATS